MKKLFLLILLLIAHPALRLPAQDISNLSFMHVNSESGLSQSNVKAIVQDCYGFIWFGTKNGLNRFDSKNVEQFDCNDYVLQKSNHNISALYEDNSQILWVGTDEGVYKYNPKTEIFSFVDLKTDQGVYMRNWVARIEQDKEGKIWAVVPDQGVFSIQDDKIRQYEFVHTQNDNSPNWICICDDGEIWICSWYAGLYRYNAASDEFEHIVADASGRSLLGLEINTICQQGDYLVMAIQNGGVKRFQYKERKLEDLSSADFKHSIVRCANAYGDNIWVGTYDGLYIIDTKTGTTTHFEQSIDKPFELSDNIIYAIYRDRENGVWLGTMFGGADYLANRTVNFKRIVPENNNHSLSGKQIREISEDGEGNLWIGTENAGHNVLSLRDGSIRQIPATPDHQNTHITLALCADHDKTYCGYYKEGLRVITPTSSQFYSAEQLQIHGSSIYAYYIDKKGRSWIGTDWGCFYAPKGSLKFKKIPELEGVWIFDIMEAADGTMWFATMGKGVWSADLVAGEFKHYTGTGGDADSLSSNSVSSIMQDHKGDLWFSTDRGGICRYNKQTDDFTRFSKEEGLPDDVAYKILEDDYGTLWFGTNRGLVHLNPATRDVQVFTVKDGLCGNQFNYKSAVKGSDGNFYFGTIEGLVVFNPHCKQQETVTPPIYITKLSIFNEVVTTLTPGSPLTQSIWETDRITLPYDRTNLTFEVAQLSYSVPRPQEYCYRLLPVDKQWIRAGNSQSISYANLLPGEYKLQIRGGEDDGAFDASTIRTLTISVLPPWWKSVWAVGIYILLTLCAITLWFQWYRRHKNRQLAEKQELFAIEKEKELYENKVSFFTEIAHEIRTPLTLINGPLELIEEMHVQDPKLTKNLNVISQNAKRLTNLASQLLDFQKVGANKLVLNLEIVDISALVRETVGRFEPTFTFRHKTLDASHIAEGVMAKVDREAITKIISNLLNNALKYGNDRIKIELKREDGNFVVTVTSDGTRISDENAELIFEPFFQINERKEENHGVGIGLALSRSLATLHHGSLSVDQKQTDNAFVLTIPLNVSFDDDNEIVDTTPTEVIDRPDSPLTEVTDVAADYKCSVILLVEDDDNIMAFMKERLSEYFIVETAANGQEALDVLHREHIDLVISDIMMPVMNGMDLCRSIKSDINLCHIPVIFLTAKNDLESKIAGLKVGAEAYIEKPFSFDFLKTQILSLLNNRMKEREAFSKRPFFPVKNMQMSKEDEEFMSHVIEVINENLKDETFNVERMADTLCMSRSSLLRKIKTLFNLSPVDFIRVIRLKKAAELILEGKYRVGEICFMVGFNSHSYFSKLFCKQFGMTPKDFEKQIETVRNKNRNNQELKIEDILQGAKETDR